MSSKNTSIRANRLEVMEKEAYANYGGKYSCSN